MPRKVSNRLPSLRQRAIACAGIGTYRYTHEGVVERMDALAFAIFGLEEHFKDPREVVGKNLTDLFEYVHPVGEGRKQVERFGRVHGLERQFNTLRGQRKWVTVDLWQIEGENGQVPLIEAVVRDITRQKIAEEALRESEERWHQLFHQAEVPKLLVDTPTGGIMDANAAAEAFYGWSRAALRERTAASLVEGGPEDATPSGTLPPFEEQRHSRADGQARPVAVHRVDFEVRGRSQQLWTLRDLSAREAVHRDLVESADRYRRLTEADADYIYRVEVENGSAVSTEHEQGCLAVTGYASEDFRNSPHLWFDMVWDEDREAVQAHAGLVLSAAAFAPIEHRIVRKDGAIRWVRNTPAPVLDAEGGLVAYDGLIRDITEQREIEEALRDSELRFRSVFEHGHQAMFILSEDLRILECNPAACALHGMTRDELIDAPIHRRMPPHAEMQMLNAFEQAGRGRVWAGESQRYGPDGELLTVEVSVVRHFVNNHLHFLVSLHDISLRKRLEAELSAIKDTLDLTLDAVVMIEPDSFRFIYANRGAAELFGLSPEHLETCTPLDIFPELTMQQLRDTLDPLRADQASSRVYETTALHAEGNLIPVEIFVQFVDPPAGSGRFVGLLRDVSERLRAEAALRESEADLARAQRIAHLGSWSFAVESENMRVSGEARGIFGHPHETVFLPYPEALEALCHPNDWPALHEALETCIDDGLGFELEVRASHSSGSLRIVTWTGAGILNSDGVVTEIHGTVQDITERKRAEEERIKLEAKMRHAQKLESLGVLAGGIAHDFNNILTAILGNAGLLLEDLPAEGPHRRRLGDIEAAAQRAAYLSQQMLSYSGRGNFVIRLVNLDEIVRETAVILSASIPKSIALRFDYDESSPPTHADASQVSQVVINLVTNAAEAIGDGPGEITVRTCTVEVREEANELGVEDDPIEPGKYVCLEVIDTGCGMTESVKSRLFDPFFTTKFTGRGLGLAAVLGIVRAHYGALQVSSTPGVGSNFRVLLPAAAGQMVLPSETSGATDDFRGEGIVLLVDDEPSLRTVGKRMLERLGFSVLTAEDGVEAVELFEQHQEGITCVLLDLVMPRMDGAETLQALYRMQPGVKVVLCSGYSREALAERFTGQQVAGFLSKPFQMRQLAAAIQAALAQA